MSGIAALFHRDGRPVDAEEIGQMLAAAAYRGPDGMAARTEEFVGLGHAKRVVSREEDGEWQPLLSPRTGAMLTADVRLDNRDELLALLPGGPSRASSDAALLLHAYDEWGVDAVARLLGDFAFILWDPRRQRLLCARDTSGQRTLYYRLNARTLAAASEIHQLLQDPAVPIAPNEEHIRESLVPFNMYRNEKDSAETYFAGVYAVPAGHMLLVEREREQLVQYWELKPPRELRYKTDDEYAEHFRALFFDAVKVRLRTSRPLGVLLSGGLDSASIACAAQQLSTTGAVDSRRLVTLTSVYDDLDCDERPFIEDMRAVYGFDARYVPAGQLSGRLQLQPAGFREAPNMGIAETRNGILHEATQMGLHTLLSGDVADSCVGGGRLVFDSLLRRGDLAAFQRHLRAFRRLSTDSPLKFAAFACVVPLLPLGIQSGIRASYTRSTIRKHRHTLVPQWMREGLSDDLERRHLDLAISAEHSRRFSNDVRESEYRLLYPPEVVRSHAPYSMETWRPFTDRRLHEFLLAIPPEQKFEPHPETDEFYAGSKRILRRAMRGVLPESIRTRTTKTTFNSAAQQEVERQWPLYAQAFGPASRSRIVERGYVRQEPFWARLQAIRGGDIPADLIYVLRIIELETWLRVFELPRSQGVRVAPPVHPGALPRMWSAEPAVS